MACKGRPFGFGAQTLDHDELDHDDTPFTATGQLTAGGLDARITAAIQPGLEAMGYDLVRVAVLGRERPTVQVMADRADGSLIGVADCEAISHAVSAILDVDDPIPGAWNLEVSSAGIDRPLTRAKDWVRFAGHLARAETMVPVAGRKRFNGIIIGADDHSATLRLDDGSDVVLPLDELRRAKLVLTDALIAATMPEGADEPDDLETAAGTAQEAEVSADAPRRGPGRFANRRAKPRANRH